MKSGELELSLDVKSIARLNIKTERRLKQTVWHKGGVGKHFFCTAQDPAKITLLSWTDKAHTERDTQKERKSERGSNMEGERNKRGKERVSKRRRSREKKGNFFYLERWWCPEKPVWWSELSGFWVQIYMHELPLFDFPLQFSRLIETTILVCWAGNFPA